MNAWQDEKRRPAMTRRRAMGVVAGAAAALVGGCASNESSYRFKVTVEVETPQGLRTGASVIEAGAGNRMKLTAEEGTRYLYTKGEAVALDIAPGKALFALLKTNAHFKDMSSLSMHVLDPPFGEGQFDTVGSAARIATGRARKAGVVPPEIYPMLVRFRDINDPTTVELVDPSDLASSFGPGVALKRITVEITDDPITTGIGDRLPWLPRYYDKLLSGERYEKISPRLADHLGAGDFSTELSK